MRDAWRGIGPTYVKHLADAGVIQEDIFAFYLSSFYDEMKHGGSVVSFVDIGELVLSHMKPNMEVVWFELVDHMYWMVEHVNGIRFGGEVEDGAYAWL